MFQWFSKTKEAPDLNDSLASIVPGPVPNVTTNTNIASGRGSSQLSIPVQRVNQEVQHNSERSGTTNESGRTTTDNSNNNSMRSTKQSNRLIPTKLDTRTETQQRIEGMNEFELDCTPILDYLYVSGMRVAQNLEMLREKNIQRIINCASGIIPNYFPAHFTYLSLNLLDGKQEDLSWFICEVIQFILEGVKRNERILVHCEKGISRSSAFVIAYYMWSTGKLLVIFFT